MEISPGAPNNKRYGSVSNCQRTADMSGTIVMAVVILSGIGLSGVYLVAEYSRWRKHVAEKHTRSESFRALQR